MWLAKKDFGLRNKEQKKRKKKIFKKKEQISKVFKTTLERGFFVKFKNTSG